MRRGVRLAALIPLAVTLLLPAAPVSAQVIVQRVSVQMTIDAPVPHPVIQERLLATVRSVTDRLLVGRTLDQLTPLEAQLGETIAGVVGRVATGYAVAAVSIRLGADAEVAVRLQPVGPVVRDVEVTADLRAVHARLQPLVGGLLQERAVPALRALYAGLPQGAILWAEVVLEERAQAAAEEALAGYTATMRLRMREDVAQVTAVVIPHDTRVIRNIGVHFRSSSIPTMLLDQHGPAVVSMAEFLRGVPVVFGQAHAAALAALIRPDLAAYPPARQYRIVATPSLDVGETTYVNVVAESQLYRVRAEAHLNVGTRAPGPAVVGHLGLLVHPQTEAFVQLRLVPQTLSMEWSLGAEFAVVPVVRIGAAYGVVAQETRVWTEVRLGFDTALRGTWALPAQSFEGAFVYRINPFLSGELVATSQGDWWLRLISNL